MEKGEYNGDQCRQCGLCCKILGCSISPTIENLFHWMESGRVDILRHFSGCGDDGIWVNCADLNPEDLGELISVELRDPVTGEYPPVCPFLRRSARNRYNCAIHTTKPDMCGFYQPWVWGETHFTQCSALKNPHWETEQGLPSDE
jgi:Fe-S-cluster containining protein